LPKKPFVTAIGTSQIGWTSNKDDGSDFIVSVRAQRAESYLINERHTISKDFVYVLEKEWYDVLYHCTAGIPESIRDVSQALMELFNSGDVVAAGFGLALALIPRTASLSKYQLIHSRQCGDSAVCLKVLAAINKSNPINNGRY